MNYEMSRLTSSGTTPFSIHNSEFTIAESTRELRLVGERMEQ